MGCNIGDAKLTIYYLAAYAGLIGLVQTLLNSINVNCSNVHGITPIYLAKLNIMRDAPSDGESDPWQDIADLIENHGGVLSYLNRKVELHLLYEHLFGGFLIPFRLNTLNPKNELFYESDFSQCTASDFDYYKTGTFINPHGKQMYRELLRINKSRLGKFTNTHLVPREFSQLKGLFKISQGVRNANSELLQLHEASLNGLERTETEVM